MSSGEGVHHLGHYVPDLDAEIARMAALDYPLLQSGRGFGVDGDGAYAYFDSESGFGCMHRGGRPAAASAAAGVSVFDRPWG
jgi:hypothetical protein